MENLQSIFKGGAYIIGILLLANLLNALIPGWSPFVTTDWITLLWHGGASIVIAVFTGISTGLLAQFFYMLDDSIFDADEKKKAYGYGYMAFFISLGILMTANLFEEEVFQKTMIAHGILILVMLLPVGLRSLFGKAIDQGGTAGMGLQQHANQAPPQPAQPQQQPANQNTNAGVKMHPFAIAFIAILVIAIVVSMFHPTPMEHPHKKDHRAEQTDGGGTSDKSNHDGDNKSSDGNDQQSKPAPPRYGWENDESNKPTPNQKIVWDAVTNQDEQKKMENEFINGDPSWKTKDWDKETDDNEDKK